MFPWYPSICLEPNRESRHDLGLRRVWDALAFRRDIVHVNIPSSGVNLRVRTLLDFYLLCLSLVPVLPVDDDFEIRVDFRQAPDTPCFEENTYSDTDKVQCPQAGSNHRGA